MLTITRHSDNTQFVLNAYREMISVSKKNLMLHRIRLLSELHGRYVCLFKRGREKLEAVFAKEPGVLLAECVWQYFDEPDNLIYCEEVPNSRHLLLVIIRNGTVYLSNKIEINQLRQELKPLMAKQTKFDIYIHGNVPLSDTLGAGAFTFPAEWVNHFKRLPKSVFEQLPVAKGMRLQALPLALREQHLSSPTMYVTLSAGVLVALLLVAWIFYPKASKPVVQKTAVARSAVNGFQVYQSAMQNAPLVKQLQAFSQQADTLLFTPGWQLTRLTFTNQRAVAQLTEDGGNLNLLMNWAAKNRYGFTVTNRGAQLTKSISLPNAAAPTRIYPSKQVIVALKDQTEVMLGSANAVQLGSVIRHGQVKQIPVTIRFNRLSPQVLALLGQQLQHLPLSLSSIKANLAQGSVSGSIQLSVWGT